MISEAPFTVNHLTMNVQITPRVHCPSVPTLRNRIEKSKQELGQWGFWDRLEKGLMFWAKYPQRMRVASVGH